MARPPDQLDGQHFEVLIIGAGMSGLAAGIRLALFGKRVLLLERHNAPGGLNSFYARGPRRFDVGLHAFTNFAPELRGSPLNRLLRQLRLEKDAFDLCPQSWSAIRLPGLDLRFSNDPNLLAAQIEQFFPAEAAGYARLVEAVQRHVRGDVPLSGSAWELLRAHVGDPVLADALAIGPFFYANSSEDDMDAALFAQLFSAIYLEGLARPYEGVRRVLRVLLDRYRALGGLRKMKCGVQRFEVSHESVRAIHLDDGSIVTADVILSSAGLPETEALCGDAPCPKTVGPIALAETISCLAADPRDLGWEETIVFFSSAPRFTFRQPADLVDLAQGVIALPNNYHFGEHRRLDEGQLRVSILANHTRWAALDPSAYAQAKERLFPLIQAAGLRHLAPVAPERLSSLTVHTDMFTPTTVTRYTGRLGGATYGSHRKSPDGRTPYRNLFLIGADQGNVGIVGAMMSGVLMANEHVLKTG